MLQSEYLRHIAVPVCVYRHAYILLDFWVGVIYNIPYRNCVVENSCYGIDAVVGHRISIQEKLIPINMKL